RRRGCDVETLDPVAGGRHDREPARRRLRPGRRHDDGHEPVGRRREARPILERTRRYPDGAGDGLPTRAGRPLPACVGEHARPHARRNPRRTTARPEAGECGARRPKPLADSLTSHASVSHGTRTSRQTGYSEHVRWTHVRRRFVEAEPHYPQATALIDKVGALYAIEARAGAAAPERAARRARPAARYGVPDSRRRHQDVAIGAGCPAALGAWRGDHIHTRIL